MTAPEFSLAASRLCADCGMCCNGVMFHTVRLQPADSAKKLAALGLKLKRKRGQNYLQQPCRAFKDCRCSVYAERPERCRLFECRQLQRLADGTITEARARETIQEARRRVDEINALLLRTGGTNRKHPLSRRCEMALAEPLDLSADGAAGENPAATDAGSPGAERTAGSGFPHRSSRSRGLSSVIICAVGQSRRADPDFHLKPR